MDYNPNSFEEKKGALVFNNGEAGVVKGCNVRLSKKGDKDPENFPNYKLEGWSPEQVENKQEMEKDSIYPVNKGFYHQDKEFKSKDAEKFRVNELKHLLKVADHPMDGDNLVFKEKFGSFNEFMDYSMEFFAKAINNSNKLFDLAVDYGNDAYPKKFLQLNGFPWYICKAGEIKLQNRANSLMKKPEPEDKEPDAGSSITTEEELGW